MMDRTALERAIDAFWDDWQRGVHFPQAWRERLDLDDAYRIQLALVARRCTGGVRQIGWKVGLTARAIQEQFDVHEPVFGCLMSEGRIESGHVFHHADLMKPGFENEVCVVLARPLIATPRSRSSKSAATSPTSSRWPSPTMLNRKRSSSARPFPSRQISTSR